MYRYVYTTSITVCVPTYIHSVYVYAETIKMHLRNVTLFPFSSLYIRLFGYMRA